MSVHFKISACRVVITVLVGLSLTQRGGIVTCATQGASNAGEGCRAVKAIRVFAHRGCVGATATAAAAVAVHCAARTQAEKYNKRLHNFIVRQTQYNNTAIVSATRNDARCKYQYGKQL